MGGHFLHGFNAVLENGNVLVALGFGLVVVRSRRLVGCEIAQSRTKKEEKGLEAVNDARGRREMKQLLGLPTGVVAAIILHAALLSRGVVRRILGGVVENRVDAVLIEHLYARL